MIITNKNSIHTIDYKKGISEIVEHFMTTASNNDFMIYYNCPLDLEENSRVCSGLHFEREYISDKKINEWNVRIFRYNNDCLYYIYYKKCWLV